MVSSAILVCTTATEMRSSAMSTDWIVGWTEAVIGTAGDTSFLQKIHMFHSGQNLYDEDYYRVSITVFTCSVRACWWVTHFVLAFTVL